MDPLRPATPEELAAALQDCAASGKTIVLQGAASKRLMAGPVVRAERTISTAALTRVLQYEPQDLTISVEAGLPWRELTELLARNRQMIPLDPPFAREATVGGVVAANTNGPRRRLYGTVRDLVIGMKFATLEGKLVQSGGMVVKNVAGLDMAKLMIGSFGTLAALAVVNFKLTPMPERTRTYTATFDKLDEAVQARNAVLTSVLQPAALDLLNPAASTRVGLSGWTLLLQAGGTPAVLDRYARELGDGKALEAEEERVLWTAVREFSPRWMADHPNGGVIRIPSTITGLSAHLLPEERPALARAGTGVVYRYVTDAAQAEVPGQAVLEFAPDEVRGAKTLWPETGSDFAMMEKIKNLFDPQHLLNRGRLYGRL